MHWWMERMPRIQPIFTTTTTMVVGLLPLVMLPGFWSKLYRGLGSVVLGGLLVWTLLTLVLVPTLFGLTIDMREAFARLLFRRHRRYPTNPSSIAKRSVSHWVLRTLAEQHVHFQFLIVASNVQSNPGSAGAIADQTHQVTHVANFVFVEP
jgi:HAE1 family hydrophobic/amphiphilic exporter-1